MVCETEKQQSGLALDDDTTSEVLQHLTFHKSLIDEGRSNERINHYIDMVNQMEEDEKISNDPFESAISSVFKLVIEEKMDPWEIDLVSFTNMYIQEAKSKEQIDFLVAGKLVSMAWSILKLQCEVVLDSAEEEKEEDQMEEEAQFFNDWDVRDYDMYDEPEDIDYEEEVVEKDKVPINKAVRREEKKAVSLIQLVNAFEEAKKEAKYKEKMERLRKEKKKEREEEERLRDEEYDTRSHEEDLYHDISKVWDRICCYEQKVITFDMIHDGRLSDIVTAMTSILFLHKQNKIKVKQLEYPEGDILVENLVPLEEREGGLVKLAEEENEMTVENMVTL